MSKTNISARQNADRVLIAGITKHLSNVTSVMCDGTSYSPPQIVVLLQAEIAATDDVSPAHAAWLASVAAQKTATNTVKPIKSALRSFVEAMFGTSSPVLADFGYTKQAQTPTVAVKAVAVEKRANTRELRGTKGKRQKAEIKGTAPAIQPTAASKPAT
jgi:hypothetical protein